ncbi:MAG: methyltransferase domain-containing protein [Oceanococcus sp.]|nr:MAG: methyltransferase domain-containing protein [Oceanococcus sp.]
MKYAKSSEAWLDTSRGQAVLSAEKVQLDHAMTTLFGRSVLQIGGWGGSLLTPAPHWRSGVLGPARNVDVRCELSALPLAGNSVDAVLLAHSLESAPSAHSLLREVDRALSARGQLLILGFNPYSVWGLWQWLVRRYPALPQGTRPLRSGRIQDWLRLLDYEVVACQRFGPTRQPPRWLRQPLRWLRPVTGWFAPVYLIRARKRRIPANMVRRPVWQRSAVAGMDGVATRSSARVVVPLSPPGSTR